MKVWGRKNSANVQKVFWCLAELGIAADHVNVGGAFGGLDTEAYLALNPNGRIPTLEDNDVVLWESNTILRYLAGAYDPSRQLYPNDLKARCYVDRWLDWVLSTLQPAEKSLFWGMVRTAPDERDMQAILEAVEQCGHLWRIVNEQLAGRTFVEGEVFTLADIVLGAYVHRWFGIDGIERPDFANLSRWYERLQERPGYREHVALPLT